MDNSRRKENFEAPRAESVTGGRVLIKRLRHHWCKRRFIWRGTCLKIGLLCTEGVRRGIYRNDVMMSRWHHCPGEICCRCTELRTRPTLQTGYCRGQSFANWSTVLFYFTPLALARGSQYPIDDQHGGNSWRAGVAAICNYARQADVFLAGWCEFFQSLQSDWVVAARVIRFRRLAIVARRSRVTISSR